MGNISDLAFEPKPSIPMSKLNGNAQTCVTKLIISENAFKTA